jgi:hypothetical protein
MATFVSRREAQENKKLEREQKRNEKLKYADLMWAAKRRYLDDTEWYQLFQLHKVYGKWGPERSEYEFGVLEELRAYFKRHAVGSKAPELNALERHLALYAEQQKTIEKEQDRIKNLVCPHPSLKKK